jgi:hypothetical protein
MGFKLDMSKAYDRVEWDFLEVVMRRMGFSNRRIRLLMTCIYTVSYAIVVNRQPVRRILPSRGIRQRDPPSPYRFIFVLRDLVLFSIMQ